jgi:arylsulfatase A-like enzyme
MKSRTNRLLFISCMLLSLLSACHAGRAKHQGDVVLIVIDTLRADHLPLYGYQRPTAPNLEVLAKDGITYQKATSPGTWTVPSHGSLFTGRWPSFHGAERVAGDRNLALPLNPEIPTLAEILRGDGFHTGAFVGNSTYVAAIFGFARGFDEFFDKDLHSPPILSQAVRAWLPAKAEPLFLFVNILDPHEPYEPPPPLDELFPTKHPELGTMISTYAAGNQPPTSAAREHFVSQYDGEIVLADRALGEILADLKRAGRYDDALIVVTSDHGEFLFDHGLAGHGLPPFEPEVHVPLVVKLPRGARAGEKVVRRVSILGVFATILRTVGLVVPPEVESRPLDAPHPVWVEDVDPSGTRLRVGYEGDQKLVMATTAEGVTTTSLYDLGSDPDESRPDRGSTGAATLRAAVAAFAAELRPVNTSQRPVIDPEREVKLRALGYVR